TLSILAVLPLPPSLLSACLFFFFNHPSTSEISTLSLHDALPILFFVARAVAGLAKYARHPGTRHAAAWARRVASARMPGVLRQRSEEHTSELQSLTNLVCRLLLEKKKTHKRLTSLLLLQRIDSIQ